jgi:transcriptional regulator with XRE-family HTH domain
MSERRVTQADLARALGVTAQAVNKAVRAGRLTPGPDGMFELGAAIEAWRATGGGHGAATGRFGGAHPRPFDGNGGPDERGNASECYYRGRAVRETYRAKLARIQFERESGLLVSVEEVRRTTFEAFRAVRDALEAIPERLDARLAAESDPAVVREILRAELRKVLADLSNYAARQAGLEH